MILFRMIRKITRPTTAKCTLPMYMGVLISEPGSTSCTRLSEIMNISHDSVNRFLGREAFESADLFNKCKDNLKSKGEYCVLTTAFWINPTANMCLLYHIFGQVNIIGLLKVLILSLFITRTLLVNISQLI